MTILGRLTICFFLFLGIFGLLFFFIPPLAVFILILFIPSELLVLYIFFHYRHMRQTELLYLLAAATEANQPLAPAVWAYLVDRPRGGLRDFSQRLFLFFVYGTFERQHLYDRKVEKLGILLESGMPLPLALQAVPGLVPREAVGAAAVGQVTGKLNQSLANVTQSRIPNLLFGMVPRFLYPLFLLLGILLITSFLMVFIVPKFERIFADFKIRLPEMSDFFIAWTRWIVRYWFIPFLIGLGLFGLIFLGIFNSAIRWHTPVVGRFYRKYAQGQVLKMLGLLLENNRPIPEALGVLADAGYLPGVLHGRVAQVHKGVMQGEPLAPLLHRHELLPQAMVPLVQTAEKANNLPWALIALGEHQAKQTEAALYRFTMIFFPISIAIIALGVGLVALAMFTPLITLVEEVGRWKK